MRRRLPTAIVLAATVALLPAAPPAHALPSTRVSPASTTFLDVAHRGASGLAPEHTFAAYDLALQLGADVIEQDVAPTADGELVVLHDDTLDRTTDCTGRPELKTVAELKQCDAGSWFNETFPDKARPEFAGQRIPTLREVLTRYGDAANFYIETKIYENGGELERRTIELLRELGFEERAAADRQVHLQSFLPQHVVRMQQLAPRIPRVFLLQGAFTAIDPAQIAFAGATANGIGPSEGAVTKAFVDDAHAQGLVVHPYTVDDPQRMAELQQLGVDGLFTNRPDLLEGRRALFGEGPRRTARGRLVALDRLTPATASGTPASGAALSGVALLPGATAPLAGQPLAGISGVVALSRTRVLALPDDQFDTPGRSADVQARVLDVRLRGGVATVRRTIVLKAPDGTPLTGAQVDPEAIARTPDGTLWVAEERGPSVRRFTRGGVQIGEPITFPGLTTPWSAPGLATPGNPLATVAPGSTPTATLQPSRGLQGLTTIAKGRKLLALVAGPLAGEPDPRTRVLLEIDARTARPTGRRHRFRVAGPGDVASDLTAVSDRAVLVIDRDTRGGRDARHKVVTRVDLRTRATDGHRRTEDVLDLLALRDHRGRPYDMAFPEVDALAVTPHGLLLANDNDLPFSAVRRPNVPDDTEFALVRPDRALRP